MTDITDSDFKCRKRVSRNLELQNRGNYYDLFVQNDMLLLEVKLWKSIETYEPDPAHFFSTPE